MFAKVLGSVGRFLITSGIVVLLFVAYQLWGTGIQEASAQGNLGDDFDQLLAVVDEDDSEAAPTTTTTTEVAEESAGPTTTIPDFDTIPVFEESLSEALYRDGGEAIARLTIPKIGVRKVVIEGVQVEDLRNGPGHYRATVMPGQKGNTGIAGHRTTYGAPFNRIDELEPGDEINVRTVQGFFTYRVMPVAEAFAADPSNPNVGLEGGIESQGLGHIIVRPESTWVLGDFGDNRITLTACHPKLSAAKRIIVAAELVGTPVDAPPLPEGYNTDDDLAGEQVDESEATDVAAEEPVEDLSTPAPDRSAFVDEVSLDEGLNGDPEAIRPAILWGALGVAVYLFFKELAKRWRRWPSLALGIVPVVLLMALAFEQIDRALPAG